MKVSDAFPSKFIAASDLNGGNVMVTIQNYIMEKVGEDQKPVLYFNGAQKGLVLNKTNAKNIAAVYGDDMEDWRGQEIVLFSVMTDFQGKSVDAVRVRAPQPKDRKTVAKPDPITSGKDLNDDIPF